MAENFYSVKTALHVGIVQILGGLVGVGIGAFNTREEDHRAFFKFKPEGLPVWSGILFIVTGGVGCLSYKHAKKSTIHFFLMFCVLTIITSILMFWIILPLIVSGKKEVSWNLFFGSFLGVVAIIFVVSMKGAFVTFKSSFFQHNCFINPHPLQHTAEPVELSTSVCMITSTSVASENTLEEIRQQRRISRSSSQSTSTPHRHTRHSHRHHTPRGYSSRRGVERESRIARYDERPPPPAYQTIKFPYLPAYQEVDESLPPPPYTEKKEDT